MAIVLPVSSIVSPGQDEEQLNYCFKFCHFLLNVLLKGKTLHLQ